MAKSIISEGKTTNEAIEKGLEQLKVSRKMVDVKVLENEQKRSFFSILAPRVVKVELTVKEHEKEEKKIQKTEIKKEKKEINLSEEEQEQAKNNIENFLNDFIKYLPDGTTFDIKTSITGIDINMSSEKSGYLIGYRGETLTAFQTLLSAIAGKNLQNRIKVRLDIDGYKEKRIKVLEELAEKKAKMAIEGNRTIKLDPMNAYERKIVHTYLQSNEKVETISIGEEPRRRIVIQIKK